MGIIAWIILGGAAGWIASMIMKTNESQGKIMNIVVGLAGAFIGGTLMNWLTYDQIDFRFNLASFLVALLGAVILLGVVKLFTKK